MKNQLIKPSKNLLNKAFLGQDSNGINDNFIEKQNVKFEWLIAIID